MLQTQQRALKQQQILLRLEISFAMPEYRSKRVTKLSDLLTWRHLESNV